MLASMPPNSRGRLASSWHSCCLRTTSLKTCSTYDWESSAMWTGACAPGYVHFHHPVSGCHPSLRNSCRARPRGPVTFGVGTTSHIACMMVYGVPVVRACRASQHILRYGMTTVGAM